MKFRYPKKWSRQKRKERRAKAIEFCKVLGTYEASTDVILGDILCQSRMESIVKIVVGSR